MGTLDAEPAERIDFAVVAYHDEGQWTVSSLPPRAATELDNFVHALVQLPSDIGTIGMVSVDDEFFVLVRVSEGHTRLLLSDVGAATESPLARAVVERLRLPPPDDDDDQMQPAGDLRLLTDLGLSAMELGAICDETELYPDELLSDIAGRLGFGSAFEDIVDGALAQMGPAVSGGSDTYAAWMRQAITQAAGAGESADVPVGALVLDPEGVVVGRGHNLREATADPTAHAEIVAIREAAARLATWRLSGHTLVVTLEPCTMCAGAIVLARLDRLVFGAYDDKAGAVGSLWDVVRDKRLNHRPEVVGGVLAAETGALVRDFFRSPR